jgi:malonyl CoA-acyl carrier protein transacylase
MVAVHAGNTPGLMRDRLDRLSVTIRERTLQGWDRLTKAGDIAVSEILDRIVSQIANPVRWDLCMQTLADQGVTGAIEVAPAGTLVGLIKRAAPTIEQCAFKSPAERDSAATFVSTHGGQ